MHCPNDYMMGEICIFLEQAVLMYFYKKHKGTKDIAEILKLKRYFRIYFKNDFQLQERYGT